MAKQQQEHDHEYIEIMEYILANGVEKGDRTGTGTTSVFGVPARFDLTGGKLPLITTKKIFHRSFVHETLWFISGSTDIKYLKEQGISIWDSWVDPSTAVYEELTFDERYPLYEKEATRRQSEVEVLRRYASSDNPIHQYRDYIAIPHAILRDIDHEKLFDLYDIPSEKLVSGSIGPGAYGAMWRNIEDTRIVPVVEFVDYESKGFSFVTDVDGLRCVITRKIDQLQQAIDLLRTNPDSRRIIVHAFDNRMIDFCQLPPCHSWFQFWTRELTLDERKTLHIAKGNEKTFMSGAYGIDASTEAGQQQLDQEAHKFYDGYNVPRRALRLLLVQRSADYPVGVPFNIAQYALLAHMVAHVTGMVAEELIWMGGDVHVYQNQIGLATEQTEREPYTDTVAKVYFEQPVNEIGDIIFEDIVISGYDKFHPAIPYPVAV